MTTRLLQQIHSLYAFMVFIILFFLLLPFFFIPILWPKQYRWVGILNRIWAVGFFKSAFLPYRQIYNKNIRNQGQYIFCANHFSYLDIPAMGLSKVNAVFVGKNDMESIPVFGYIYRKLHITVDRSSLKSRYLTLQRSKQAIDEGKSLIIFPEGGIRSRYPPAMAPFKDGAFRIAIEKQMPIVPVTIANNWIVLPDGTWLLKREAVKVIYHKPVETKSMDMGSLNALKQMVYKTIDNELKKQNEDRPSTTP